MKRRDFLGVIGGAVLAWPFETHGQTVTQWPDRPVRLLVPVGAGGAADTLSRNLSNGFAQFANGQPLIVENRPGAGGTIAAAAVAREKPDGYNAFPRRSRAQCGVACARCQAALRPAYRLHADHPCRQPAGGVLIRPGQPYTTLPNSSPRRSSSPGKFNYASAGPGNWTHLFMAYLNSQAGIDKVNVIYRSGSEMLTALLRGETDTAVITVSTALGQIKEGKVRTLAGFQRAERQLPDTPPVPGPSPASTSRSGTAS